MRALASFLAAAAVGVAIFWDGGFDASPQWAFAALAVGAGLVALTAQRLAVWSAPLVVLLGLAALQAVSAAWATVPPGDSLRAAALTVGYAALVVAGSTQSAHRLAAVIAVTAGVSGVMGLVSASLYSDTFAERIEGGWRPEGPLGYPPALALVQVFALPALLTAVVRARPAFAGLAAAGMAVAGGVLVLVANRVTLAFAILMLGIAFAVSVRRALTALAIALLAVAALAFHELLGGWTSRFAETGPGTALVALGIICGLALLWIFVRRQLGSTDLDRKLAVRPALAAAGALVAVAIVAGLFSSGALSARRFDPHQGFTHGRTWMWSAAYHTAIERPLYGFGAGSFFEATVSRQPGKGRVTRFAHDLPLELGVENGVAGLLLALALYAASGHALWRARGSPALWLLGPAVATFLLASLVDWPWHLAGVGALVALALGGLGEIRTVTAGEYRTPSPPGGLTPARARRP